MSIKKKDTIEAKGFAIQIYTEDFKNDYISLTDIAKYKNSEEPNVVVANWMRNYNTIEYLGIWEQLNNLEFNPLEFEGFLKEAGSNAFTLSPQKWVNTTNAKGIYVKVGRGGGTFAHKDIAFKFASWISAEFELYIVKDYQRLKDNENSNCPFLGIYTGRFQKSITAFIPMPSRPIFWQILRANNYRINMLVKRTCSM